MQARVTRTMASVGSFTMGSGTFSTRTSPAPYITVARMLGSFTRSGGSQTQRLEARPVGVVSGTERGRAVIVPWHGGSEYLFCEPGAVALSRGTGGRPRLPHAFFRCGKRDFMASTVAG